MTKTARRCAVLCMAVAAMPAAQAQNAKTLADHIKTIEIRLNDLTQNAHGSTALRATPSCV